MNWILLGLIASFIRSLHIVSFKMTVGKLDPLLTILISSGVVFCALTTLFFATKWATGSLSEVHITQSGLYWALVAGITLAAIEVFFITILSKEAPLGTFVTMYNTLSLIGIVAAGMYLFGEQMTLTKVVGILLGIVSIILLLKE